MLSLVLLLSVIAVTSGFPGISDEVIILPGLRIQPTFKHYSGYLNGSDTKKLHYWFVTSQSNPDKDPLVLWLTGGPGCSSVDALLSENGPFQIKEGFFLEYNPHSWNKIANVIYLESPSCVGYSYSTDGKCDASDDSTALLNLNALKHFYIKFPQYKNRDFHITGESYGGYYVPSLAELIVLSPNIPYIRLKGIAVGNGLSSWSVNNNGNLHFAYNHGLISDRLWSEIILSCCHNVDPLHCDIPGSNDSLCIQKVAQAQNEYSKINPYNIYAPCMSSPHETYHSLWSTLKVSSNYERLKITLGWNTDNDKRLKDLRTKFRIFTKLSQTKRSPSLDIPCTDVTLSTTYMNKPRVRYALHIPQTIPKWEVCSSSVNVNYKSTYANMTRQYNTLFKLKNFRIWIYNGDVDMMCSYLSDEWYFGSFNRPVKFNRQPWPYTDINNMTQIGGFIKVFDKFSLITVRGAGHMVPTDKPIAAFVLFKAFLT